MAIDNANAETRYAVINASTREYNLGFILREKCGVALTRIRNGVSIAINPEDCTIGDGKITLKNSVDIKAGDTLVLSRVTPDTQEVVLTEGSELPAKAIEHGLDRAAMRCAELDTKIENVRKYSLPTATVTQTATGATITITNASGTTTANIANGKDGKGAKGDPGDDGISPTATVTQTATGATITITDKNGTTTANVTNGKDGGYKLPVASASTLGGVKVGARMSIDSNGVLSADDQSSSYKLPVASASTLGGVKELPGGLLVINSDGSMNIKRNQKQFPNSTTLELYIAEDSGLEVPNTAQGGLRIKQSIPYTTLSGTSVSISPAFKPYKLNATAATTLNVSAAMASNTNYIGYAEIVITVGESGSITAGENFTLVDSLTAGKTNYCVVRWEGNQAKLFVWRVE